MNKHIEMGVGLMLCCAVFAGVGERVCAEVTTAVWQKVGRNMNEGQVSALAINQEKPEIVLVGTPQALYRSDDGGKTFRPTNNLSSSQTGVNQIFMTTDDKGKGQIWAAMDSGVLVSSDGGVKWDKVYDAHSYEDRALSVLADKGQIYVGTAKGLLYREEGERSWRKMDGELGRSAIYKLAADNNYIFALTTKAVYRFGTRHDDVKEIFNISSVAEELVALEGLDADEFARPVKDLIVVGLSKERVVVATERGVLESPDAGENWVSLPVTGLPVDQVNSLVSCLQENNAGKSSAAGVEADAINMSAEKLFAATEKGAFYLEGGKWQSQYQGLESDQVTLIACSSAGEYAATDKGLFYRDARVRNDSQDVAKARQTVGDTRLSKTFVNEPTVQEVQRLAVHYADVSPNKTYEWANKAKRKALLPTVSVGLDREATNLYHWDTTPNPDQLLKGQQYLGWDVSVSWDLSELVWNNDVTSIDSRAKLTSELREDILAQVTRLYFERRRLQLELAKSADDAAATEAEDKNLRIAELTALIDGFTGGEFSRRVERQQTGTQKL